VIVLLVAALAAAPAGVACLPSGCPVGAGGGPLAVAGGARVVGIAPTRGIASRTATRPGSRLVAAPRCRGAADGSGNRSGPGADGGGFVVHAVSIQTGAFRPRRAAGGEPVTHVTAVVSVRAGVVGAPRASPSDVDTLGA